MKKICKPKFLAFSEEQICTRVSNRMTARTSNHQHLTEEEGKVQWVQGYCYQKGLS